MFRKLISFNVDTFFTKSRKMSVFTQKLNPITGANDWIVQNEDYDYHQEVARASFADMLHDTERNQLYEKALKAAIEKMHASGKKANVLDIGTGTSLLSMMAVRNGADSVVACEAFKPMAFCALDILKLNGYQNKVRVINKRSTELTVGDQGDLKERCNILVTEVFDTELIGEGALSTFSHAHRVLLEDDCIVVPNSATVYAQVVECPLAQNWNKLKDVFDEDGEILVRIPDAIKNCAGTAAVHDIQMSQLPQHSFNTVIAPTPVLSFDWSGKTQLVNERSTVKTVKSELDGKAQAVFMWWELQMDTEGEIVLSCAPHWAHPEAKPDIPWRDHWMQAIYYFPKEISVRKGQEISLVSCHDEYSLWFNLVEDVKVSDEFCVNPVCECGVHVNFSRNRIGQMNDSRRSKKFIALLEKCITEESIVLVLSDGFYLALAAAKFGAKKMYFLETNHISKQILQEFVACNNIQDVEIIPSLEKLKDMDLKNVNVVLSEPYYTSSILSWDNISFLYLLKGLQGHLRKDVTIFPKEAVIKGVAVKFKDLHKIRAPLGSCEGFSMKSFDDLIEHSSDVSDDNVEAQPLWEYPGTALCPELEIATIDLTNLHGNSLETKGVFKLNSDLYCNGIGLWVDWILDESAKITVTTGPIVPVQVGEKIQWDMYTRQGVCLFPGKVTKEISYSFIFDVANGNITFNCC